MAYWQGNGLVDESQGMDVTAVVSRLLQKRLRSYNRDLATIREDSPMLGGDWRTSLHAALQDLAIVKQFEGHRLNQFLAPVVVAGSAGLICTPFTWVYMPIAHVTLLSTKSVVFHGSMIMTLWSYHQGMVTDPGGIPDEWSGEPGGQPRFVRENPNAVFMMRERKKTTGEFRYCSKMRKFKPDRSHFCSQCRRGVLRMDHHCPWLINCVGHYNYKAFFLTLFYSTTATVTAASSLVPLATKSYFTATISSGHTFLLVSGATMSVTFCVALVPFTALHCYLLANNMTTIEFFEHRRTGLRSPYDLGLIRNLQSILGSDPLQWMLPVGKPPKDGTQWEVNHDEEESIAASAAQADPPENPVTWYESPCTWWLDILRSTLLTAGTERALGELWTDAREALAGVWPLPAPSAPPPMRSVVQERRNITFTEAD